MKSSNVLFCDCLFASITFLVIAFLGHVKPTNIFVTLSQI